MVQPSPSQNKWLYLPRIAKSQTYGIATPGYEKAVCGWSVITSEVATGCKRRDIEGWLRAADHGGDCRTRRGAGGETDMLVAEGEPETGMPRRRPDHRQAIRQGRPRPAPAVADGGAEFDDAARHRLDRID